MPGAYTSLPTYTLPGRAFGLNDVTARVQVIQFDLKICTGITWTLPLAALTNSDPEADEC